MGIYVSEYVGALSIKTCKKFIRTNLMDGCMSYYVRTSNCHMAVMVDKGLRNYKIIEL